MNRGMTPSRLARARMRREGNIVTEGEKGRFFRPFKKEIGLSGLMSDTLSNVIAGLLAVLLGGILISNSTWQFSVFTSTRNAFVSPVEYMSKLDGIRGIAVDDETILRIAELSSRRPGGIYDAFAAALRQVSDYARTVPQRRVVAGFDFVINTVDNAGELSGFAHALADMPDNLTVVLGAALNSTGTRTAYFRYDLYRDVLLAEVRNLAGDGYVARHVFTGNLHIRKARAVSGFQELETDIALGYDPLTSQAGTLYGSLPFMMYLAGQVVPPQEFGPDGFSVSLDGYLASQADPDPWLKKACGYGLEHFLSGSFRYNFFSGNDLSTHPLGRFNHFSLGELDPAYSTDGQGGQGLVAAIGTRDMMLGLSESGLPPSSAKADYFLVYRSMSLGYIQEGASTDLVVTPASQSDDFSGSLETVSGAMTHLTGLSNLIHGDSISELPWWLESLLALVLALVCFCLGSRAEFRTIMVAGAGIIAGVVALGFGLFLASIFLPLRLPLMVSLLVLLILASVRFIRTVK